MFDTIGFWIFVAVLFVLFISVSIYIIRKYHVVPGWMVTDPSADCAYEYTIEVKPDCFERSQETKIRCGGASDIENFVCNDCATCKYWAGKV